MTDHTAKAREIAYEWTGTELVEAIAQALADTEARVREECAVVAEGLYSGSRSDPLLDYCYDADVAAAIRTSGETNGAQAIEDAGDA